jgi:coenzyme PQQ precursor peptide PqqA
LTRQNVYCAIAAVNPVIKSGAEKTRQDGGSKNDAMVWSTPEVREVCVGMEVTSYLSAEM